MPMKSYMKSNLCFKLKDRIMQDSYPLDKFTRAIHLVEDLDQFIG